MVAGEAGGRRLRVPPGDRIRPSTDRVKESVFSALGAGRVAGARVLDLYAGTGALGIEALSRGAAAAVLVERDPDAVAAITANLEATGVAGRARAHGGDVGAYLAGPQPLEGPFDLVFVDPPYELPDSSLAGVLASVARPGWTARRATVVVERAGDAALPSLPAGWGSTWERRYGDTLVFFAMRE